MNCAIEGCSKQAFRKGLCTTHGNQMKRFGHIPERTNHSPNEFIIEGLTCKISIHNIKSELIGYALIDAKNLEKCKHYKWCINTAGYIWCNKLKMYLHQYILGLKGVDHKNRNKLDCREENLRSSTKSENNCNKGLSSQNSTGYKGVSYNNARKMWYSQIKLKGNHYWLGYFVSAEEAALAWNKAARELHGEFAYQNIVKPKLKRRNYAMVNSNACFVVCG